MWRCKKQQIVFVACLAVVSSPACTEEDEEHGSGTELDSSGTDPNGDSDNDSDADSDGDGGNVVYAVSLTPAQTDLSEDYVYDAGDFVVYRLDGERADYEAGEGAEVDLSGLRFHLVAGGLLADQLDKETGLVVSTQVESAVVQVFRAPLEEWTPRFDHVQLDALYYIDPYFAMLSRGGVELALEPPANWREGDVGTTYMLGDYDNGLTQYGGYNHIYQEVVDGRFRCVLDAGEGGRNTSVEVGRLADCGAAVYQEGSVITSAIPNLGWVGVKKGKLPFVDPPEAICIARMKGRLVDSEGTPIANVKNAVQICKPDCKNFDTDENGHFQLNWSLESGESCRDLDLTADELYIHLTVREF